jgi:hypothetical protein
LVPYINQFGLLHGAQHTNLRGSSVLTYLHIEGSPKHFAFIPNYFNMHLRWKKSEDGVYWLTYAFKQDGDSSFKQAEPKYGKNQVGMSKESVELRLRNVQEGIRNSIVF